MTAVAPTSDRLGGGDAAALGRGRGRTIDLWSDRAFRALALGAGLSVLAILALIAIVTTKQSWPVFRHEGFGFITSSKWDPAHKQYGALAFIYGTVIASLIGIVLAVPMSLGIALFTTELAPRRLRKPVVYVVDLLAAIPSVVYGLWALAVFKTPAQHAYQHVADTIGKVPLLGRLFGGQASGASFFTAGIVLAVMITPIVTAISREVLATVAQDDKNAALAMGATRWEMLRVAVFPRARSGLVGAVMLGLGRALGETIAVALVIGSSHQITSHLFKPGDSMAAVIAHEWGEGQSDPIHLAALIGLAVLLFAFTIVINVAARRDCKPRRTDSIERMTATTLLPPGDPTQWVGQRSMSRARRVRNGIASAWMIGAVAIALVPVVLIVSYVAVKGAKVMSWGFLSQNLPFSSGVAGGGIWPAIGGTVMLTATAAAMAVPLGVLAAVYLNEYGRNQPLARTIRFMSDVMTGVPSVVMGLFISLVWVRAGLHQGFSTFAGSLALGCLMLPIVIRSSEEMLKLVPNDLRHASEALGARRSRTVLRVVLPAALPGIVSGAMLAIARAAGETAPLLFTIGTATRLNTHLFGGTNTALPREIWTNAQQPFAAAQDRAWGAALTLIALVFLCTLVARAVSARFATFQGT